MYGMRGTGSFRWTYAGSSGATSLPQNLSGGCLSCFVLERVDAAGCQIVFEYPSAFPFGSAQGWRQEQGCVRQAQHFGVRLRRRTSASISVAAPRLRSGLRLAALVFG